LNKSSHFVCSFKSFGLKDKNYEVSLLYVSEDGVKVLTNRTSKIYVLEKGFPIDVFYGSNKGGYEIGKISLTSNLPTDTYSNYEYSLKLDDRSLEIPIEKSTFTSGGFVFTMVDVSKYFKSWDIVERSMKLNLYINSIRSISFYPYFTFFRNFLLNPNFSEITIDSVSPSSFVKMSTRTNLNFKIKEQLNQRSSIRVKYVHESNQAQIQDCRVNLNNIIQCSSPSFDQIGKVNVLFTINEGSYADAGQTLQIYSEKTIVYIGIFPKMVSPYSTLEVIVKGEFLKNESQILVKYTNSRNLFDIVGVLLSNQSMIIAKPPSFYLANGEISIIQVEISFDNGNFFQKTNLTIDMEPLSLLI
jgi:hypothetical protein